MTVRLGTLLGASGAVARQQFTVSRTTSRSMTIPPSADSWLTRCGITFSERGQQWHASRVCTRLKCRAYSLHALRLHLAIALVVSVFNAQERPEYPVGRRREKRKRIAETFVAFKGSSLATLTKDFNQRAALAFPWKHLQFSIFRCNLALNQCGSGF